MANTNEATFSVDVTSDEGQAYNGKFTIRRKLSLQQILTRDAVRRDLLGPRPESAPDSLIQLSHKLSVCLAHVTNGPVWWQDSNNGLNFTEEEPLNTIFENIINVLNADAAELEAKKKAALSALAAK
jgi:hypothetical protein